MKTTRNFFLNIVEKEANFWHNTFGQFLLVENSNKYCYYDRFVTVPRSRWFEGSISFIIISENHQSTIFRFLISLFHQFFFLSFFRLFVVHFVSENVKEKRKTKLKWLTKKCGPVRIKLHLLSTEWLTFRCVCLYSCFTFFGIVFLRAVSSSRTKEASRKWVMKKHEKCWQTSEWPWMMMVSHSSRTEPKCIKRQIAHSENGVNKRSCWTTFSIALSHFDWLMHFSGNFDHYVSLVIGFCIQFFFLEYFRSRFMYIFSSYVQLQFVCRISAY